MFISCAKQTASTSRQWLPPVSQRAPRGAERSQPPQGPPTRQAGHFTGVHQLLHRAVNTPPSRLPQPPQGTAQQRLRLRSPQQEQVVVQPLATKSVPSTTTTSGPAYHEASVWTRLCAHVKHIATLWPVRGACLLGAIGALVRGVALALAGASLASVVLGCGIAAMGAWVLSQNTPAFALAPNTPVTAALVGVGSGMLAWMLGASWGGVGLVVAAQALSCVALKKMVEHHWVENETSAWYAVGLLLVFIMLAMLCC